jgi:hypothetical protein
MRALARGANAVTVTDPAKKAGPVIVRKIQDLIEGIAERNLETSGLGSFKDQEQQAAAQCQQSSRRFRNSGCGAALNSEGGSLELSILDIRQNREIVQKKNGVFARGWPRAAVAVTAKCRQDARMRCVRPKKPHKRIAIFEDSGLGIHKVWITHAVKRAKGKAARATRGVFRDLQSDGSPRHMRVVDELGGERIDALISGRATGPATIHSRRGPE